MVTVKVIVPLSMHSCQGGNWITSLLTVSARPESGVWLPYSLPMSRMTRCSQCGVVCCTSVPRDMSSGACCRCAVDLRHQRVAPTSSGSGTCASLERCTTSDWWTPGMRRRTTGGNSLGMSAVVVGRSRSCKVHHSACTRLQQLLSLVAEAKCLASWNKHAASTLQLCVASLGVSFCRHFDVFLIVSWRSSGCCQRHVELHSVAPAMLVGLTAAGWCLTHCTCCCPLGMKHQRRQKSWIPPSATSGYASSAVCWKHVVSSSTKVLPRSGWTAS